MEHRTSGRWLWQGLPQLLVQVGQVQQLDLFWCFFVSRYWHHSVYKCLQSFVVKQIYKKYNIFGHWVASDWTNIRMSKCKGCFNRLLQAHQLLCGRGSVLIFLALCKKSFGWNPWNPQNFRVDNNFLDSQVVPNPFVWEQGTCRVFIVTTQALRTLTCRFICSFTTRKGSDMEHGPHGPGDLNLRIQICNLEFSSETWGFSKFIYMLKSMFRFFYISLFQFIFYLQGEASLVDASARPLRKRAWVMDIKNFANMMTVGWNGVP